MRFIKYLTPLLQPVYRIYVSRTRSYRYGDICVRVSPGVFYPGFIFSTRMFLEYLDNLDLKGKTLLEIGAGSGILSLLAAKKGAVVTATDINPAAVKNITDNSKLNGLNLDIIESDLFENVPKRIFDYIIIAPPYYPKDPSNLPEMAWYCGKNFRYFEELFRQMPSFCENSTTILMILSEDCDIPRISEIAIRNRFEMNVSREEKRSGEWNFIFEFHRGYHR